MIRGQITKTIATACIVFGLSVSAVKAQETTSVGINPVSLAFGVLSAEVESCSDFRKVYFVFSFQNFNYSDSYWTIEAAGATIGIKSYFTKAMEGGYIKPFIGYAYASATYSSYYVYSQASASVVGTGINLGYRWNFGKEKKSYIAPELGFTYVFAGELEASNGDTYDLTGITPSGGLVIGYRSKKNIKW